MTPVEKQQALGFGTWLIVAVSSIVAVLGLAAVWAGLSVHFQSLCAWMLVVVALDAALLLRLAGVPAGPRRVLLALIVTTLTVAAATLLISAARIGMGMGVAPPEAIQRLSPGLITLYLSAQLQWADALWLLPAGFLGWRLAR